MEFTCVLKKNKVENLNCTATKRNIFYVLWLVKRGTGKRKSKERHSPDFMWLATLESPSSMWQFFIESSRIATIIHSILNNTILVGWVIHIILDLEWLGFATVKEWVANAGHMAGITHLNSGWQSRQSRCGLQSRRKALHRKSQANIFLMFLGINL